MRTPLLAALCFATAACASAPRPESGSPAPGPPPATAQEPQAGPRVVLRLEGRTKWASSESSPAHEGAVYVLRSSKDGRFLATLGADRVVRLWDAADGRPLASCRVGAKALGLAFSPDGSKVAVGDEIGSILILDRAKWEPERLLHVATIDILELQWSQVAPQEIVVNVEDGALLCVDLDSEKVDVSLKRDYYPFPAAAASTEATDEFLFDLAIGERTGRIRIDTEGCRAGSRWTTRTIDRAHEGAVTALLRVPRSEILVSGGKDGVLRLWDLKSLAPVAELAGISPITDLLMNSDSRILWVAREDGTVLGYEYADLLAMSAAR